MDEIRAQAIDDTIRLEGMLVELCRSGILDKESFEKGMKKIERRMKELRFYIVRPHGKRG